MTAEEPFEYCGGLAGFDLSHSPKWPAI
jgi:hypothetical protein